MDAFNLEDVFQKLKLLSKKISSSQELSNAFSGFISEGLTVEFKHHQKLCFRNLELSDVIFITFPEEAIFINRQNKELSSDERYLLTGIPCFYYNKISSESGYVHQDKIEKCDYGTFKNEGTPMERVIHVAKETQRYLEGVNLTNEEKHRHVMNVFFKNLTYMFAGNVKENKGPTDERTTYIVVEPMCILIEVRSKLIINKNVRNRTPNDFNRLSEDVKKVFGSYEGWLEVWDVVDIHEQEPNSKFRDWVTMLINFCNREGPNIRFIMDSNLRDCILNAAEAAKEDERKYRQKFYLEVSKSYSIVVPFVDEGVVKFISTFHDYPSILKVNGAHTCKTFIVLQELSHKVKFNEKFEKYRKKHGIALVRLTFDFENKRFHENHNPLRT